MHEAAFSWADVGSIAAAMTALVGLLALWLTVREGKITRQLDRAQHLAAIRAWGDECLHALAKAQHIDGLEKRDRDLLKAQLSALADRGRWLFPNDPERPTDTETLNAYRGYRDNVLDPLIEAYKAIESEGALRSRGRDSRREFCDRLQSVLRPTDLDWLQRARKH